jgi:uncharacterized membrane protein (UPF0127 family)
MMKSVVCILLFSLFARAEKPAEESIKTPMRFASQKITVGKVSIQVEMAETHEQLERGLMYRKVLRPEEGMLFIFEKEEPLTFWMKNTYLPLSVGFFNHEGVLVDIQEMEAVSQLDQGPFPTYSSSEVAQFALEMNKGWFKRRHIGLKARLSPVPRLHKGRD